MAERVQALITPAVLVWAREQRGIPPEAAADKIGISLEKLIACEMGNDHLSIPQLRAAADTYKRPMAVFYLKEVPRPVRAEVPDFRRLPDAEERPSAELLLEMRRIREKQEAAASLAEYGPPHDWSFLGMMDANENTDVVAAKVRKMLGISERGHEQWRNEYQAFNAWRVGLESLGVLVFQVGGIEIEEMRGFSISRKPYPAIVVNTKDSPEARIFSLLHEFAHLLLNRSGLCNLKDSPSSPGQSVETFCNYVAGSALLPDAALRSFETVRNHGRSTVWTDLELSKIAKYFKVSQHVVLRRLLILSLTSESFYRDKCAEWAMRSLRQRGGGGGESGVEKVLRTQGRNYVRLILGALQSEAITAVNVSEYLDMKLKHLSALEQELNQARGVA